MGRRELSDWELLRLLRRAVNDLSFARQESIQTIRESVELLALAREIERPLLDPNNKDHKTKAAPHTRIRHEGVVNCPKASN
jgi:hypothetical protein